LEIKASWLLWLKAALETAILPQWRSGYWMSGRTSGTG
jgi:hypothetical protein